MTAFLDSIVISNFRSLRGRVAIPLGAPVVLIHGANAVGKTSVISAIELVLTGAVSEFERADPDYVKNLVNKDSETAIIALKHGGKLAPLTMEITSEKITGPPLLNSADSQFFSERCYLGQATLARLLERYEVPIDSKHESALSKFVKDLLGVDRLDALIEGLYIAGDIRRVRSEIEGYRITEQSLEHAKDDLRATSERIDALRSSEDQQRYRLLDIIHDLTGLKIEAADLNSTSVKQYLNPSEDNRELDDIAAERSQLKSMLADWKSITASTSGRAKQEIESRASQTQRALTEWRSNDGRALAEIIEQMAESITNIPHPDVVEPTYAFSAAEAIINQELARHTTDLAQETAREERLHAVDLALLSATKRLEAIRNQLEVLQSNDDAQGEVLSSILHYIHSDVCPVCDRDYSEVSTEPLANHIVSKMNTLSEKAARFRTLSSERIETERRKADLERERQHLVAIALPGASRQSLAIKRDELVRWSEGLRRLRSAANKGTTLRQAAAEAARAQAQARKRDRHGAALRRALIDTARKLNQTPPSSAEMIAETISRLTSFVNDREETLHHRLSLRNLLSREWSRLVEIQNDKQDATRVLERNETKATELETLLTSAENHRTTARAVANAALRAKNVVVHRVFTNSLNRVWRDMFVRLAPDEPFIPRFVVPPVSWGELTIRLETVRRDGAVAGTPLAMLSTGNLNTAALTLFLALHMSVKGTVPLLILDDPVQSMDELHTVQLAALLRMISKRSTGQQIIVAVHERSLFDYLTFELAPSFEGDRLITVELDHDAEGNAFAESDYHEFEPETAVA